MCGRFANDIPIDELVEYYSAVADGDIPAPSWNIAPTARITTVLDGRDGVRHAAPAYWNLIPSWSATARLDYPTHNARVESVFQKRSYALSARTQRCIIPACGYYEWDAHQKPHYFSNPDGKPLSLGGLYTWWRAQRGDPWMLTATILTRESTGNAATVHNRMPVLIPAELRDEWLNRQTDGQHIIPVAAKEGAIQSSALLSWTVEALKGDGRQLIQPEKPKV